MQPLPGSVPSPNIWHHPATYEVENRAADPHGRIEAAMAAVLDSADGADGGGAGWAGRDVLDLGCGTGFHLPRWARGGARTVVGVEPHPDLARHAARRTRRIGAVTVTTGTAQALPLPDSSVDVVHVRWAYFFGPGSEPGLRELTRVLRPGGTAFVVDNDGTRSTFGRWFREGFPTVDPAAVERFWSDHGWSRQPLDMGWRFASYADLEAVVRLELPATVARRALAEHAAATRPGPPSLEVDYAVNLFHRAF